jgi:cytochrome c6
MKIPFALLLSFALATAAQAADDASELWTAKCKSCHGADGQAKTKMGEKEHITDMSMEAWQKAHSDADIRKVIAEGSTENTKMKAYKDKMTPEQIDSLVAYIRTLKK